MVLGTQLQLSTSYQKSFAMTPHSAIVIKPFNFDRGKIKGGTGRDPGKGKGGGSQGEPAEGQGVADSQRCWGCSEQTF